MPSTPLERELLERAASVRHGHVALTASGEPRSWSQHVNAIDGPAGVGAMRAGRASSRGAAEGAARAVGRSRSLFASGTVHCGCYTAPPAPSPTPRPAAAAGHKDLVLRKETI